MGVVFRARHPQLERMVALKAMLPNVAARPEARDRFTREAKAMAKLKDDHVVAIYDVDEDNGVPFLAMEYLQGESLDGWLKKGKRMSVGQVLRVGREIAQGLAAAHAKGLVHRDIKPANIWLEAPKARVKILDFGLARGGAQDVQLTQSGAILGTPAYMAPEQGRGEAADSRSDLFSLGCVLYRLSTGKLAFEGPTIMAILTALATTNPPPVSEVNPDIPGPLSELIMRLLAKRGRPAGVGSRSDPRHPNDRAATFTSRTGRTYGTKAGRHQRRDAHWAGHPHWQPQCIEESERERRCHRALYVRSDSGKSGLHQIPPHDECPRSVGSAAPIHPMEMDSDWRLRGGLCHLHGPGHHPHPPSRWFRNQDRSAQRQHSYRRG